MRSYECPYAVGTELVFRLHPPRHPFTDSVNDTASTKAQLVLKILETCFFTKSQTLKVSVVSKPTDDDQIPPVAFLKLYDRRYLDERMGTNAMYPWNHKKEAEAEVLARASADTGHVDGGYSSDDPTSDCGADGASGSEESGGTDQDDDLDPWQVEEYYHDLVRKWFKTEVKAYQQLQPLQGICVPKFFGTVAFDDQSLSRMPPGILTEVRGILLQFIEGSQLDELDSECPLVRTHRHIGQAAVMCFERIHSLGVLHGDVRLGNLMVRNHDGRVFLLDFALSTLRGKHESDLEWTERVRRENEVFAIKEFLQRKALRDRTPQEPFTVSWVREGYVYYNSLVDKSPEAWRKKYYEKIAEEPMFETRTDTNGEFHFILPKWRVNEEAAVARVENLASITEMLSKLEIDKEM